MGCHSIPFVLFVSPTQRPGREPEWFSYLQAFRKHGFVDVQLREGGSDLLSQMRKILEYSVGKYTIVMSDLVNGITWEGTNSKGSEKMRSLPLGLLRGLWEHGFQLMEQMDLHGWSLSASHDGRFMNSNRITLKLGLLDGNMTGLRVTESMLALKLHSEDGLIYDVAWACHLWHAGFRFARYLGMCCQHPYRSKGGQASLFEDPNARRETEDRCVRRLSLQFPELISWSPRQGYSLKRMQYQFRKHGPEPIQMEQYVQSRAGRPS